MKTVINYSSEHAGSLVLLCSKHGLTGGRSSLLQCTWIGGWLSIVAVRMDWWVVSIVAVRMDWWVVKYCYSMHGLVGG